MAKKKKKNKKEEKRKEKELRENEALESPSFEYSDEIKRLNRISGQVEGLKKMLVDARDMGDVLIQCKAIHSALKSIEGRVFKVQFERGIQDILKAEKKKEKNEKIDELAELFRKAE